MCLNVVGLWRIGLRGNWIIVVLLVTQGGGVVVVQVWFSGDLGAEVLLKRPTSACLYHPAPSQTYRSHTHADQA